MQETWSEWIGEGMRMKKLGGWICAAGLVLAGGGWMENATAAAPEAMALLVEDHTTVFPGIVAPVASST